MSELDRYLDDLGGQLDGARPRPGGRRLAALALVAAAAAAVFSLAGRGDSEHPGVGPVDAVAKARAALQVPPGQMLHMRLRLEGPPAPSTEDLWVAKDPLRWRQTSADGSGSAYGDGVYSWMMTTYIHRLERVSGYTDDSPQARVRTLLGVGNGDPSRDLQAALTKGKLVDAGEVQSGGRTVRRLETKDKDDPSTLIVLIYDVDPVTFAPVGGERIYYTPPKHPGGPRRPGPPPMRFTVEAYERLPLDEAKLRMTPGPGIRLVELTKEQLAERVKRAKRWERRCAKLRRHHPSADCGKRPTSP